MRTRENETGNPLLNETIPYSNYFRFRNDKSGRIFQRKRVAVFLFQKYLSLEECLCKECARKQILKNEKRPDKNMLAEAYFNLRAQPRERPLGSTGFQVGNTGKKPEL